MLKNIYIHLFSLLLCCVALLLPAGAAAADAERQSATPYSELPFVITDEAVANLSPYALIKTNKGFFEIRFFADVAPVHVLNFQHLARTGFYNNIKFYRYIPNYIIQGGDKNGDGSGGTGYTLAPEFSNIRHKRGIVAMSRIRGERNPHRVSNGSQFYICLGSAPQLDGLYSIFAEVVNGMDVVEQLRPEDEILEIRLSG